MRNTYLPQLHIKMQGHCRRSRTILLDDFMAPWGYQLLTSVHPDVFVMLQTATTSFMISENTFSSSGTNTIALLRLN
jgi:hypothetical protein